MASAISDIVEEVVDGLLGYVQDTPQFSTLTISMGENDQSFTYDTNAAIDRGYVEIDNELLYVSTVQAAAGTAACPQWARGQQGTTAAAHASGSRINVHPRFPRARIMQTLNQVVGALDSDLFGVQIVEFPGSPAVTTYPLPSGVVDVLQVSEQSYGPSQEWFGLPRWRLDLDADRDAFPTGLSLTLPGGVNPGRKIKVVAATALVPASIDGLISDTGLDERARDILVLGCTYRLLLTQDFSRVQLSSVEQQARNSEVPITSATKLAGQVKALFDQRVAAEKTRLRRLYPAAIHFGQ